MCTGDGGRERIISKGRSDSEYFVRLTKSEQAKARLQLIHEPIICTYMYIIRFY